ncbi:hypothetical protein BLOT_011207 [Blomia tropicalis]|nr:hypothetical protein BLOT_011207 [Blomia tropicalis]
MGHVSTLIVKSGEEADRSSNLFFVECHQIEEPNTERKEEKKEYEKKIVYDVSNTSKDNLSPNKRIGCSKMCVAVKLVYTAAQCVLGVENA